MRSAGTPGDVMPVADKGKKQNERPDDQNAAGFKPVNVNFGRTFSRRLIRLRLWADGGHVSIVAPRGIDIGAGRQC
jgi:hypothetical protein